MAKKKITRTIPVDSLKHKDKRANIPTEELRDFIKDDENHPKTILYPRDPSLDPQLVWKGKDEQDASPLAVPSVPIYIQEKIHPQAIIEDIRSEAKRKDEQTAPLLFSDFNGIDFERLVDFYQHEQNWSNRMILGDSLLVMTSLAEKEALKGKVQMIYIDPPYGIKFGSNWQVSTRKRDIKDGKAEDTVRQPEQVKAFRDTWKLGIHSYLAYLRDRFVVARDLLTETGSIFVQIGDENVHLVRCLLDEVFGSENFCSIIMVKKTSAPTDKYIPGVADFLIWYGKDSSKIKYRQLYQGKDVSSEGGSQYVWLESGDGVERRLAKEERENPSIISSSVKVFAASDASSSHEYSLGKEPVEYQGRIFIPGGRYWSTSPQGMNRIKNANRFIKTGTTLFYKRYLQDFPVYPLVNIWTDTSSSFGERIYVVQTTVKTIERCLLMTTDPGDLVLDPTCGSGTTAYVAELWGRRWITIDTSRVALALARTRLMSARLPYYALLDSPDGQQKEAEAAKQLPSNLKTSGDIKKGFVYKRVPHVTLKSIANNEEIDTLHRKWQPKQDEARSLLNKSLRKSWEEWEVPREADSSWTKDAKDSHKEFWRLKRERQAEIDDSIAKRAEQEILYDQPFEDSRRVRVSGPFTVESLSPHRILSPEEERPRSQSPLATGAAGGKFEAMILENLKAAGVKTTKKGEGIKFLRIDPYAGIWIQAEGEYLGADGKTKRVAICIGPEHGTVAPQLIKEAAKEAVQGVGFDVLVVCGFAFDPHVAEESARYGKLNVMVARMNPDLAMGDELLKKTGSGNLFMVFGEPDIEIKKTKDGKVTVEIKGVDVYDPTTGQVRTNSTEDIACWFIDTNYNGESFFVRHAYFSGGDEPYEKLKRALRAEVDEAAWEALYSTKSRPFPTPETGRIAVKVINHYGDEVLKVYPV
ncbi:MAG: site-specific DNA-methyltransferase [Acidobacteria bacterium]|nr:site-specific DNA-methyltransferase [Acidobacteriota bacterium]